MLKTFSLLPLATIAIAFMPTPSVQAQLASSGNLTAEVSALKNQVGQVCFSLFDSSKGFPNDSASIVETKCVSAALDVSGETLEASDISISVTFESIPLGTYAVSAFHDENEDGELNQGNFGIPLEGFGFSQNPSITTRAPEFSETAIVVVGRETTTEIELIYY